MSWGRKKTNIADGWSLSSYLILSQRRWSLTPLSANAIFILHNFYCISHELFLIYRMGEMKDEIYTQDNNFTIEIDQDNDQD